MISNGLEAIKLMRVVQRLKKKFIAKTLADIELEFQHAPTLGRRAAMLKTEANTKGAINTDMLMRMLDDFDDNMPEYAIIRKIVLDNFNEFARNIFQALLGDEVEGYGQNRRRY